MMFLVMCIEYYACCILEQNGTPFISGDLDDVI